MAEPTAYDEIQDGRLDSLESLISAEYEPPAGSQYSYPVASQGITQDQWQQMNLTTGDGAIITDGSAYPFRLVGHDSDSETNQRNTLILKVADNTGRNEASMAGFYFRQTEDIELPFPPVTSTTTYHVTVTYDPRKFKTEPLRLEVWAGEPPRAHGQQHILLHTVARTPNQLLSQAVRTMHRHYVSPVITAAHDVGLPDSKDVLYGTLGIVRSRTSGGDVVPGTGAIFESRGGYGWHNLLVGEWQNLELRNGWTRASTVSTPQYRYTPYGLQLRGRPAPDGSVSRFFAALPEAPVREFRFSPAANPYGANVVVTLGTSGIFEIVYNSRGAAADLSWLSLDGLTIPLD